MLQIAKYEFVTEIVATQVSCTCVVRMSIHQ